MAKAQKIRDTWYSLDNAANLYPAVSNDANTNVFRLSCELGQNVEKALLQRALDAAIKGFPNFRVIMRRGLFWLYLERSDLLPQAELETDRPCGRIFYMNVKELLFRVTYYRRRINLEVFHAVADGGGAIELLRTIVYHYLLLIYPEELAGAAPLGNETPPIGKSEDSFHRYYTSKKSASPFREKAYCIRGTLLPKGTIQVIEACVPTSAFLALAKAKGVTATAYMAALLLMAIHSELMPRRASNRPIAVNLPVDLRGHFSSETARNFFAVVDLSYNFSREPGDFDSVLASVSRQLREKVRPEALEARLNYTMGVQRNLLARFTPLFVKNFVLRVAYRKVERTTTCALSNLGRITMPKPFEPYISRFGCLLNPTGLHRLKLCVCSFREEMVLSFTSCIAETSAQKYFIRHLTGNNIDVRITCNGVYEDEIL